MAASGGGRFRATPHLSLRPFVVEYWGSARDLASMGGFTITPDCFGELICCVDDLYAVDERGRERLPTSFLIELLDRPLRIEADGVVRCMAARLQPWSIGSMMGNRASRAGRGWRDAASVFGPWLAPVSGLVERCDWPHLVGLFDELLMGQMDHWTRDRTGVEVAGEFLGEGRRPTAIVARERLITSRQVERRVRDLTRTSPKQLACLSRFQKARDAIWADPATDLAALAVASGYSDQPHMTRDFRRYSGQTPAQFARGSVAKKRWLTAQDVAFVQDRAVGDG